MKAIRTVFLLSLVLPGLAMSARAQAVTPADCAVCHEEADGAPAVTDSMVARSSHAGFDCLDCHGDVADLPHPEKLEPVNCGGCHETEAEVYKRHGRGRVGEIPDLPSCADCHGTHDILPSADPNSSVSPAHLPSVCRKCHEDLGLARKYEIDIRKPVERYVGSVHGQSTQAGNSLAATCTDCHSTGGSAHRILPPGDPESRIYHFNVPHTCGKCHKAIEQAYEEGIHGKLAALGETDTPVCTYCHGEHGILKVNDPRSPVSPALLAEETCAPCHESAALNEKFGLPAGRLASYIDSYHGLKSKAGDTHVANCASCHGAHRILPSTDPRSSIYPGNLQKTCRGCHPRISAALANMGIHKTGAGEATRWSRLVASIYVVAITVIIGLMAIHWVIDLRKKIRDVFRMPSVRRMTTKAVTQHMILAVTFIVLVITGFALRYSDADLFRFLFGWDGGFRVRGIVHRVSAVAFILVCIWHLFYLRTPEGREFWRNILPRRSDFSQFWQMLLYNLERRGEKPRFGCFGYVEKAEYWALVWGSVVMIVSGLFLWFDNQAVRYVPKGFIDVMLVVHFYEAILATLAIAIWHLYSTVFNPTIYPGNPAWVTGKMPEEWHAEEHPMAHPPPNEPPAGAEGDRSR